MNSSNDNPRKKSIDWNRFGLNSNHTEGDIGLAGLSYGTDGHQPTDANELFAGEQNSQPWWKSQFFISQPVLFGTWDGVFTSCLINIFGVIVFLRSGWLVAQAGVLNALLIVVATVGVALITVLSAVGICERCRMESGGVYFLLAHVLGSRLGGAIGLVYVFGQAVGCSLFVLGLGEAIAGLVGLGANASAHRLFASAAVLLLSVINLAGVKWVVKLQFALLLVLLLAGLDFAVGSFVHTERRSGFQGWMSGNLEANLFPAYSDGYGWFTTLGVFFPTVTGVLAGINMSGDLRNPSNDIPNGTLAACATGTGLYLIFVFFLGATCTREALRTDFMIAAKVSALRVPLLAGLYVSSMSSCLGAMYGTPRVLQSIANENVIPGIHILGKGRGPNRVPVYAMGVVATVIITFTLCGNINTLAPIVTMPFLMTYATVDYAYFALAQTFDIQHQRELRFRSSSTSANGRMHGSSPSLQHSASSDLDTLFPERSQHRGHTQLETGSQEQSNVRVHNKRGRWYSSLCNRWLSLFGALVKVGMMLMVDWGIAAANLGAVFVIWLYVGLSNPAVKPGASSQFRLLRWLQIALLRICGRKGVDYEEIVIPPEVPNLNLCRDQINEENEDFAYRQRFHQTASIRPGQSAYGDVQLLR
ncbi:solute carrier family 12 member 8 isoform X2 [Macrosteles quadrilineatus]|uniref:solute carrier family 12 member 8 isoform X2 n=1 Tax=Macrosteles quadrilineatus TaxID=74068 RepID=UPI0023E24992|nr:solute carrier family 12 member 8 isoform X2 [Macrosteles quadrilineatus]